MKNKRVLITGGAGFIGSHLVDQLINDNHIIVVDDFSSGRMSNLSQHIGKKNLKVINADIRDRKKMVKLTRGIDFIYHLAVSCLRVSIYNPELSHQVNAAGTLNMCMAALKNKVKRFIYVSSSEVYGSAQYVPMDEDHPCEPITVYAASKLAGEYYCKTYYRTYGLPVIIVRPFNTYGPREHYEGPHGEVIPRFAIRALNNLPPVIFGDGTQMRDFTYVTEVASGIKKASRCDALTGNIVNIAFGRGVKVKDIAKIIVSSAGKGKLSVIYRPRRPGDVHKHYADISKARKMLDFNPQVDIRTGIKKYLQWLEDEKFNYKRHAMESGKINWLGLR